MAQPYRAIEDESSVTWWTLTDSISPAELRSRHTDSAIQTVRFEGSESLKQFADAAGLEVPAREDVIYFFNPRDEPEYTPLWLAFDAFGVKLTYSGNESRARLAKWGVSDEGRIAIEEHVWRFIEESNRRSEELAEDTMAFVEFMRQELALEPNLSARGRMYAAWQAGELDDQSFRRGGNRKRKELERQQRAWLEDPLTSTASVILPQLRSTLEDADWQKFREFLVAEVVPGIGSLMETRPYD